MNWTHFQLTRDGSSMLIYPGGMGSGSRECYGENGSHRTLVNASEECLGIGAKLEGVADDPLSVRW